MSFLSEPVQNILIRPGRQVGPIPLQVVVNESTTDTLTVTKQPVQTGASIVDHSYLEPTVFAHSIYFAAPGFTGGQSLAQVYQKLRDLQQSGAPFDIVTPKRLYKSMLMTSLTMTTDKSTENTLAIHASYQQVIFVPVLTAMVNVANQKNPAASAPTQTAGKKSVALQLQGGAGVQGPAPGGSQ